MSTVSIFRRCPEQTAHPDFKDELANSHSNKCGVGVSLLGLAEQCGAGGRLGHLGADTGSALLEGSRPWQRGTRKAEEEEVVAARQTQGNGSAPQGPGQPSGHP